MDKDQVPHRVLIAELRAGTAACATCVGAAALAIGLALMAITALILLLGALGAGEVNPAPHTISSAAHDAAVAFYLAQLVGLAFFHHTAELRFAAIPGLLLVGLSIVTVTTAAVRLTPGPVRRKMIVALAMPIPYALLAGLAGLFVPLHLTARGFGAGIAVSPSPVEAFLLPLGWGLLFASVGGLIGAFGKDWRREASRLLGVWTTPLTSSLRVLTAGLVLSASVALLGGLVLAGGHLGLVTGHGFGQATATVGGALLALPTLAAAVLVSAFGVPFNWRVDALSHAHGSISVFGGTVPSSSASLSHAQAAPGVLALAPIIALVTVFAVGWLSARRSGPDAKLCLANALRAATLTTLVVWLLALLARVDAQAGGLLGLHLAPVGGALLWRIPLVAFVGCLAGCLARILTQGPSSRRQLATILLAAVHPSRRLPDGPDRPDRSRQGLAWRAALGAGFAAVPVLLVGIGAGGAVTSAAPAKISLAPIGQAAEQRLERDSGPGSVSVTVNSATRVIDTASVHTPLHVLEIAPGESRAAKARDVLERYGDLFGLSEPDAELGDPEVTTDRFGMSHVYFPQTADGLPVFGGRISVHFSGNDEELTFISGSAIPEVSVAESKPKLSSEQAVAVAQKALPSGGLAQPASLQVYAGLPPYISGPQARLAWFVWLIDEAGHASSEYVVDAVTGKILDVVPKANFERYRKVYDAEEKPELPGKLVRIEEQEATGDEDTDHAYDYSGVAYKYFDQHHEFKSWDGNDSPVVSSVHYAKEKSASYENAFWNGQQMVFGNGYALALDIVGHEMTHGVTEHTSGLIESGQSGALNESFSDMMGATMEIEFDEEEEIEKTEKEKWEIGEELPSGAIRSLKKPSEYHELEGAKDESPDPEKLSEWDSTCLDNFGVHINSTITSHAYYLVATSLGLEYAEAIFFYAWTKYLNPGSTLEDARAAVLKAAELYFEKGSKEYEEIEAIFDEVGLDGSAQPSEPEPECEPPCSFESALRASGENEASAVAMLATLYKARGELAQSSAAGRYFLPLYEESMPRISELVSGDPTLAEMAVSGLREITPALEALMEGEGDRFTLSTSEMAKIQAALRRLASDDRLFAGENAGELASLIERELRWLKLPSYGGMTYAAGWKRLNGEVETFTTLEEETETIIDPNCTGHPYPNDFQVNGFYVDTPGHYIPGQISPLRAGGVACGAAVEATGGFEGCGGEETLNTQATVQLPPGDKVNSTKNLPNGSWVGEAFGNAIACAGSESILLTHGQAGLTSLKSWSSSQCPEEAIACYEGSSTYKGHPGHGYAWVTEEGGALTLTTGPVEVEVEVGEVIIHVPVSFGQFEVDFCARAGEPETTKCGGATAPWLHENGEATEPGCPTEKGRYAAQATNAASETTLPKEACVRWDQEAHMQTIDEGTSLNAVSCIPGTTDCVAADSEGNALYSTNVSASAEATWTSWGGPSGKSPSEAVECPTTTLCLLADGEVSGGGGNLYHATSLGGSFSTSLLPSNGVNSVSCPSSSFCVTAQQGGYIRYSTKPSGISWTAVSIGSGGMKDVSCLSSSFCAVVDDSGHVHVATTEKGIKESSGWTSTDVDGTTALLGISCTSTSSCVAVDGSGEVLELTIEASGEASAKKQEIEGAGELTAVTCTESTCVSVDGEGAIFGSTDAGSSWAERYDAGSDLTSVSCASVWLCAAVTSSGDIVTFNPAAVPPNRTQSMDEGNSLNAASCIPETTECVVSDSEGNAYYATDVGTSEDATWNLWSGPEGESPSQAVACPSSSLCLLTDGKDGGGRTNGGSLYYATSFGSSFSKAYSPVFGVDAISCPSSSFCVDGQDGGGFFRYSTDPASTSWTLEQQGKAAMKAVSCPSSSFCAIADSEGRVHVATSTEQIESSKWTETEVDGSTALNGIACTSTTSCLAVDGEGSVLLLTIDSEGKATASKRDIDYGNDLTAVTCTTSSTCVVVDGKGNILTSMSAGKSWSKQHALGVELTGVSCSSNALCIATDSKGSVTVFDTR